MAMAMLLRRVALLSTRAPSTMALASTDSMTSTRVVASQERRGSTAAPTKATFRSPRRWAAVHRAAGAAGTVLEHAGYQALQAGLAGARGALDTLTLHILADPPTVNQALLRLDALSPRSSTTAGVRGYKEIQEMKERGEVKVGGFTAKDDQMLLANLEKLLKDAGVNKVDFQTDFFSDGKNKAFKLQRQLVGFSLLQGLEEGDRRLPMEVYFKLATLLSSGTFTEEEDAAILAWVEEHGPTRWTELARSLGRTYQKSGERVKERHLKILQGTQKGLKRGAYSLEEVIALMKEVARQSPGALEEDRVPGCIDWGAIGAAMARSVTGLPRAYQGQVVATLRRHRDQGGLRGEVLRQVAREGWRFRWEMEFGELEGREGLEGRSSLQLQQVYGGMLEAAREEVGAGSKWEVAVEQVQEWWDRCGGEGEGRMTEKEQGIVEAYNRLRREVREAREARGAREGQVAGGA